MGEGCYYWAEVEVRLVVEICVLALASLCAGVSEVDVTWKAGVEVAASGSG